jgi:hypothetical protein
VLLELSAKILKTVTPTAASVHSAIVTPPWLQLVPSVCLTSAARTRSHASSTQG